MEIRSAANVIVQNATQEGQTTEGRLRDLLTGLRSIDAPKTLILVSQGFYIDGGASRIDALASLAAAAQTTIYGLAVDEGPLVRRRASVSGPSTADRLERTRSLENLASASRGTFLSLTGNGAPVFERVARELSGYYLLGVESEPADSDGRPHGLRVVVNRTGATVRARRSFVRGGSGRVRSYAASGCGGGAAGADRCGRLARPRHRRRLSAMPIDPRFSCWFTRKSVRGISRRRTSPSGLP